MNIFILFLLLLLATTVVYHLYGKDLLTPSIWFLLGYDMSIGIALTKYVQWGDISTKTVIVIIIGVLSFLFGGLSSNNIASKKLPQTNVFGNVRLKYNVCMLTFLLIFMSLTAYMNYKFVITLADCGGFISGESNILTYARAEMESGEKMPYYIYIPIIFTQVIAYLISHNIAYKIINKQLVGRIFLLELLCILVFCLICVLSTGRTMFMHYLLFLLADICILAKFTNNWSTKSNGQIIKYGIIVVFLILAFFWGIDLNFRASRYGTERQLWDQISKYTSSSIYALNTYLQLSVYTKEDKFETLYNIASVLNKLGFDMKSDNIALPFTYFYNDTTNVYTALRRYIHDFNYFGMILIQFFVGFFYQIVYKKIKDSNASLFTFIMYCTFIYAPVFNCIEERVLINVLSLRSAVAFCLTYIFIKLFTIKRVIHE